VTAEDESDLRWLYTDSEREAVLALAFAEELLPRTTSDSYYWKWLILAIHNSLHAFMVMALSDSDGGLSAATKTSRARWLTAYRAGEPEPELRLKSVPDLLEALKSPAMRRFVHSRILVPTDQEGESVLRLHRLRNQFIHFQPMTWYVEIAGLPTLLLDCLSIIEFVAFESGNVWWQDSSLGEQAAGHLKVLRTELTVLQAQSRST
jgi:hypothetical protein